jgi:flagellar hook-associated protein 2
MSTSPFSPITLNGVSQYSTDLQSILNRAVQIARIPITALQNRDADVLQQKNLLGQLQSTVSNLGSSLSALGTLAAQQAIGATSSDPTVVSATATGASSPASYTVDSITSIASAASERSLNPVADSSSTQVSANGSMELMVGSKSYSFTLGNNTLIGLRDKINSQGAGVTASILTTADGNYLSVSSNTTGRGEIQLIDDPGTGNANIQLLTATNPGSSAQFQLNGIDVTQSSNLVNGIVPGLTLNLLGSTDKPVSVTLSSDSSQLSSALQTFTSAYNAVRHALNSQEGPAAGLLSGDTVITQLEDGMRKLAAFHASGGSIAALSGLGITFDTAGQASFDPSVVSNLSDTQISDAFKFIGSASTGLGGLSRTFSQIGDPVSGLIQTEQAGLTRTDQSLEDQVSKRTARLTAMQNNLAAQLQKADALIAELQSQQQNLNASLQSLNLVLYGKNKSTS